MKKSSKFNSLATFAVVMTICAVSGNAQAQSNTELRAEGFVTASGALRTHYVLVPSEKVPFVDINLGDVDLVIPPRQKGDGAMVAPVRIWINGDKNQEINPASKGVFISPTTKRGTLRVHWTPLYLANLMKDNPAITGPGFGLSSGDEFLLEDGSYTSQFYVPKTSTGAYVTGNNWQFLLFTTPEQRTTFLKSEAYTLIKKEREKAKAEEKPKDEKTDDKKDGDKKEEKKEEKKGENPTTQPATQPTTQPSTQPANKE